MGTQLDTFLKRETGEVQPSPSSDLPEAPSQIEQFVALKRQNAEPVARSTTPGDSVFDRASSVIQRVTDIDTELFVRNAGQAFENITERPGEAARGVVNVAGTGFSAIFEREFLATKFFDNLEKTARDSAVGRAFNLFNQVARIPAEVTEGFLNTAYAGAIGLFAGLAEVASQLGGRGPNVSGKPINVLGDNEAAFTRKLEEYLLVAAFSSGLTGARGTIGGGGPAVEQVRRFQKGRQRAAVSLRKTREEERVRKAKLKEVVAKKVAAQSEEAAPVAAQIEADVVRVIDEIESGVITSFGGQLTRQEVRDAHSELFINVLNEPTVGKILNTAEDIIKAQGVKVTTRPQKTFQIAQDLLRKGNLKFDELFQAGARNGVTPEQLAVFYGAKASGAGRTLQQHSAFSKRLFREAAQGSEGAFEAARAIAGSDEAFLRRMQVAGQREFMDIEGQYASVWHRGTNIIRMALVTQPATAARNALTQVERIGIDVIERAINEIGVPKALGYARGERVATDPLLAIGEMERIFRARTKQGTGRRQTKEQIDELIRMFPDMGIEDRIRNQMLADLTIQTDFGALGTTERRLLKSVQVMNFLNIGQERIIRSAVMATEMDRKIRGRFGGMTFDQAIKSGNKDFLLTQDIRDAMYKANDLTFSLSPNMRSPQAFEAIMGRYVKTINQLSPIAGLGFGEFFPRFFYNASKFTVERTPMQFLKIASAKERALMRTGDSDAIGKAFTGTALFSMAFAIRSGNIPGIIPGPRADQFILERPEGDVTMSLRPFAPVFIAQLGIADLVLKLGQGRTDEIRLSDIRENVLLSGARFDAVPSVFSEVRDYFAGTSSEAELQERLARFAAGTVGLSLTAFRTLNDIGQEFNTEYRVVRTAIEKELGLGQIQKQLPGGPTGDPLYVDTLFGRYTREFAGFKIPPSPVQTLPSEGKGTVAPLPEVRSVFQSGPLVYERFAFLDLRKLGIDFHVDLTPGLIKQFTGVTLSTPLTFVSRELEDLGFRPQEERTRTSNRIIGRTIDGVMGPLMELAGSIEFSSPAYQRLTRKQKRLRAKEILREARSMASQAIRLENPDIEFTMALEKVDFITKQAAFENLRARGIDPVARVEAMRKLAIQAAQELRTRLQEGGL